MSYAVDANVFIYAVNEESEFHHKAHAFINTCIAREEAWVIPWPTIHAFLRIVTNAGILPQPLAPEAAITIIDELISLPQVQVAGENDEFWRVYKDDFLSLHLRGNLVPDGVIVAILKSQGVSTFYTKDRDYLRFKGIKVLDPTV
jgi:hypothetical protein